MRFVDEDKMSPVQLALETARFEFTLLHGATISREGYSYVFDNTKVKERIDEALSSIGITRKRTVPQTDNE